MSNLNSGNAKFTASALSFLARASHCLQIMPRIDGLEVSQNSKVSHSEAP